MSLASELGSAQKLFKSGDLQSALACCKRAITLDMASEEGLKMFWDMVGNFDVVVDNFAPHVMAKCECSNVWLGL